MTRPALISLVALIIILLGGAILVLHPGTAKAPVDNTPMVIYPSFEDMLKVSNILPNQVVSSPLVVNGQARGGWYFEASFPYKLKDASGATIAEGPVQAQGDWMTSDYVPFSVTINFPAQPIGSVGTLILHNDNPSGEPANDKELDIPVKF